MSEPTEKHGLKMQTKVKIGMSLLVALLVVAFVVSNMEVVEVNLLIARIEMRRSVMIVGVFLAGFLVGWSVRAVFSAMRK